MSVRASSAPGKVIVSGEYAVLNGAPAIAIAVNRRAKVGGGAAPAAVAHDQRLLTAVCAALDMALPDQPPRQDTDAFYDAGARKLGLGSSAALAVALCKSLAPATLDDEVLRQLATQAHTAMQGGAGSGVDIATSVSGGVIRYIQGERPRAVEWPEDLCFRLFWSGVPASTTDKLARLAASAVTAADRQLDDAARQVASTWTKGNTKALLDVIGDYVVVLDRFDQAHALGIFEAGHRDLWRSASENGIVYKPCGAGGGDLGIALAADRQALEDFAVRAVAAGFLAMDISIDHVGAAFCAAAA